MFFKEEYAGKPTQILVAKYAKEFAKGLFSLSTLDGVEFIETWNVPNVAMPDLDSLVEYANDADVLAYYTHKLNQIANEPIYQQLDALDIKSVRALRTNDTNRLAEIEQEAQALRAQLLPTQ